MSPRRMGSCDPTRRGFARFFNGTLFAPPACMTRICVGLLALFAIDTAALAQDTPFARELRSIEELNTQVKEGLEGSVREGRRQDDFRDAATQLAEALSPMLWPHELTGADAAAQSSFNGLVQLATAARELSERGAKYDEVISMTTDVQALIFQARFAIRRAERDARLAGRIAARDQHAAQQARDAQRQNAHLARADQQRAASAAAHREEIRRNEEAARRALQRQNAENARQRARVRRSNRFRAVAGIVGNAAVRSAPRARRAPRRTHVRQRTTVRSSNGRTRTTTVRFRASTP